MNKIGELGSYSEGKLNPTDEGDLQVAIHDERGNVRIDFGKKVAWVAMPPETAIAFARLIIKRAESLMQ